MHHAGFIPRESSGTVRYAMENIGRSLVRIDLDSGRSLILLAEDVAVDTPPDGGSKGRSGPLRS